MLEERIHKYKKLWINPLTIFGKGKGKWIALGSRVERDATPQVWCNSSDAHNPPSLQHSLLTTAKNKLQRKAQTPHNPCQSTHRHKEKTKKNTHSFTNVCLGIFPNRFPLLCMLRWAYDAIIHSHSQVFIILRALTVKPPALLFCLVIQFCPTVYKTRNINQRPRHPANTEKWKQLSQLVIQKSVFPYPTHTTFVMSYLLLWLCLVLSD